MRNKRTALFAAAALTVLAAFAIAGRAPALGAESGQPLNVTAIHDPMSPSYDSHCLKCHASVLRRTTSDPRILPFHQAMITYVPGYSARKGPQDKNCVMCHRDAIDFRQESGASLRRTVDVESCVYCHGRSGPGANYYE